MDRDNDGIGDVCDVYPDNTEIHFTDFRGYQTLNLYPEEIGTGQSNATWNVTKDGTSISQTLNSNPGLAVGNDFLKDMDFEGTLVVNDVNGDDDYVGLIFGYQNNSTFYVLMWKREDQTYWVDTPFVAEAKRGLQLKVVTSETGPGPLLRNALWHTGDTENEVQLLWHDPKQIGWQPSVVYKWQLIHRPLIGLIRSSDSEITSQ